MLVSYMIYMFIHVKLCIINLFFAKLSHLARRLSSSSSSSSTYNHGSSLIVQRFLRLESERAFLFSLPLIKLSFFWTSIDSLSLSKQYFFRSLQMSGPMILRGHLPKEDPLEGLPELRAEHRIDDRIQGGVEVAQPEEERDDVRIERPILEDRHQQGQDEERQPARDKGARDDGQRLGGLPLPLGLETHVLFVFPAALLSPHGLGILQAEVLSHAVAVLAVAATAVPVAALLFPDEFIFHVGGNDVAEFLLAAVGFTLRIVAQDPIPNANVMAGFRLAALTRVGEAFAASSATLGTERGVATGVWFQSIRLLLLTARRRTVVHKRLKLEIKR